MRLRCGISRHFLRNEAQSSALPRRGQEKKACGPVPPYYPRKQAEYLGRVDGVQGGDITTAKRYRMLKEPPLSSAQQKLNFTNYYTLDVGFQTLFRLSTQKT